MIIIHGPVIEFTTGLKGTYLLFISLDNDIIVSISGNKIILSKGYYIYVGSAFGSGGLSSRLHRHIRKKKKKHWHIDQVTMKKECEIVGIAVSINQKNECELSKLLHSINNFSPVLGFGNSDCRSKCNSHFLKLS